MVAPTIACGDKKGCKKQQKCRGGHRPPEKTHGKTAAVELKRATDSSHYDNVCR